MKTLWRTRALLAVVVGVGAGALQARAATTPESRPPVPLRRVAFAPPADGTVHTFTYQCQDGTGDIGTITMGIRFFSQSHYSAFTPGAFLITNMTFESTRIPTSSIPPGYTFTIETYRQVVGTPDDVNPLNPTYNVTAQDEWLQSAGSFLSMVFDGIADGLASGYTFNGKPIADGGSDWIPDGIATHWVTYTNVPLGGTVGYQIPTPDNWTYTQNPGTNGSDIWEFGPYTNSTAGVGSYYVAFGFVFEFDNGYYVMRPPWSPTTSMAHACSITTDKPQTVDGVPYYG